MTFDSVVTAFRAAATAEDGDLARRLELPAGGWTRKYRARLFGKVTQAELDKLATGVTIDKVKYGPVIADLERSKGVYAWASVSLSTLAALCPGR